MTRIRIALMLAIVFAVAAQSAEFRTTSIQISNEGAAPFLVQADDDTAPELAIIDGSRLTIGSGDVGERDGITLDLPDGAQYFDVTDVNGDGQADVVILTGTSVAYVSLGEEGLRDALEVLFPLEDPPSPRRAEPWPRVLVIAHEGATVVAIPYETRMELRAIDGELIETISLTGDSALSAPVGSQFIAWSVDPPQIGPGNALELRVNAILQGAPQLPGRPAEDTTVGGRLGTARQARAAADLDPDHWPWFPLRRGGDTQQRVLYALAPPEYRHTFIRMRWPETRDLPEVEDAFYTSPKRRYPGIIAVDESTLPDFNGDGFVDLLLWNAPMPGTSVDSLSRAVQEQSWPLRITAHLFDAERGLYEAAPRGHIDLRAPTMWFIERSRGVPLRHLLPRDLDGDGGTDIALASSERVFGIWLFRDRLRASPDFTFEAPADIREVALEAPLGGDAGHIVVLRTDRAFHAVRIVSAE